MKSFLIKLSKLGAHLGIGGAQVRDELSKLRSVMTDEYLQKHLFENLRYQDSKRLNRYEYQVHSQSGEDGIVEEIFARLGTTNRIFVEIGVQDGLECNTTWLLLNGWTGLWIDANESGVAAIRDKFGGPIRTGNLKVQRAFVTAENVQALFDECKVPLEFDLLSIDVDGNDYWIWKAIERFKPRVVVIEYNAIFREKLKWVMRYNSHHVWDGTTYFNSSLKSLELLGRDKGYNLVGCNFHGVNAFFVRQDLVADHFCAPFTSENHFEPARYHMIKRDGHRRSFGDAESI